MAPVHTWHPNRKVTFIEKAVWGKAPTSLKISSNYWFMLRTVVFWLKLWLPWYIFMQGNGQTYRLWISVEIDMDFLDDLSSQSRGNFPSSEGHNCSVEPLWGLWCEFAACHCCVELSSCHRHSTLLLSLSSTNSGKSAGEQHWTLLMESKGTFSPRPGDMGMGRGGNEKGA